MESTWRQTLTKFLTLAYLLSAAVITVATSKAPDGSGGTVNWGLGGVTNYSVRSNCSNLAYNVDAIRVENGTIRQTLDSDGVIRTSTITDFTQLGFVQSATVVGMDQYVGSATNSTKKCLVRSKQLTVNSTYDSTQSNYSYLQPGSLTTVQYDCYNATAYQCSITLGELKAGELSAVY